ncbi:MAG: carbamoyl-phosphate synthase large subunit, partial [Gammaproteobacteria bacterium]
EPYYVKSPVFPFEKFPGVDMRLGPEMKSTGEVMGVGEDSGEAFAKAQLSAGQRLPLSGKAFISVADPDKAEAVKAAERLSKAGFEVLATRGTAAAIAEAGIPVKTVLKIREGRPNPVDMIKGGEVALVIYTPVGTYSYSDDREIRGAAAQHRVPCITTRSAFLAAARGIEALQRGSVSVFALQDLHAAGPGARFIPGPASKVARP